jgi:hypothetical protein
VHSLYCLYRLLTQRTTCRLAKCSGSTARCLALTLARLLMRGIRVLPDAPRPAPPAPADDHHVAALMMPRAACGAATTAAP